jgi:hypothetical protein
MQAPLTAAGRVQLGKFRGTPQTLKLMRDYAVGPEGEQSFVVRQYAESIVRQIAPKDYLSEILALHGWATSPVFRYTNDALHVEQVKSPLRILNEVKQSGTSLVDCDDIATLLAALALSLGRRCQYVIVGFGAPGSFTHVFTRVQEPKSKEWIILDPVAGTRDAEMASRAIQHEFYEIDS